MSTSKKVAKKKKKNTNVQVKKGKPSQLRRMPKRYNSSPSILRKKKNDPKKNPLRNPFRKSKSGKNEKFGYKKVESRFKKKKPLGKPIIAPVIRAEQYPDRESVVKLRKKLDNFSLRQLLEMKVVEKNTKKNMSELDEMVTPSSPLSTLRILNSRTRRNKFANSKLSIHERLYDKRNYSGVAKKKVEDLGYSNPTTGVEFLESVTKNYMDKYNLESNKLNTRSKRKD